MWSHNIVRIGVLVLVVSATGCSDTDHNGQPDTVRPEVRKAAGEAVGAAMKEAGKAANNARIAGSLRMRLENDPVVGLYRLHVAVANGTATLTGEVNTGKEKAQAGKIAREQEGVTSVRNRIVARTP